MCRGFSVSTDFLMDYRDSIRPQHRLAEYDTLEKALALDQKLSTLHSAMMDCSTCSSDSTRNLALLRELDILCTLYVAGQAKFAASNHHISKGSNEHRVELGNSTVQIGRYVLDSEEGKVVGRVVVKQGLDHLQKKLQLVQAGQKSTNCEAMQKDIAVKVREILSRVWEASAYGCL